MNHLTVQQIRARRAGAATGAARGTVAPSFGEQRRLHRRQRFEFAHHALPPLPRPPSPAVTTKRVGPHSNWMLHLQHLDRRVPRVRHPNVHPGRPVRTFTRALPATDSPVVGPGIADPSPFPPPPPPPGHLVHRPPSLRGHVAPPGPEGA